VVQDQAATGTDMLERGPVLTYREWGCTMPGQGARWYSGQAATAGKYWAESPVLSGEMAPMVTLYKGQLAMR